ncbi:NAD(P)/FAD-dependent oxidoreductase [Trichothermofontia sp.]
MSPNTVKIIVIGGGAAGVFGAIAAAEAHPQARVVILEAGPQPLAKVRISGGGRCNVTHACFDPVTLCQAYPRGSRALRGAFTRFQPRDTIAWFAAHGVALKTEADGRMFPVTDDSETIVQCLLQAADRAGVRLRTQAPVVQVEPQNSQFRVVLKSGEGVLGDRILLATGSHPRGYQIAQQLGHTLEPPVPSLFTFNVPDARLQNLAGVSVVNVHLRLRIGRETLSQTGPLLITHWGLSGPAVLKLSAWGARSLHNAHYQASLVINWVPDFNPDSLRTHLLAMKQAWAKRTIAAHCPVPLPRRLWQNLVSHAGITANCHWAELSKAALQQLSEHLLRDPYIVTGKGAFKEEFVTCGGVSLAEVDFKTMASRCCPGLYLAGEVLDIDGITGGFNFQSAWTTGWLAGQAMELASPPCP